MPFIQREVTPKYLSRIQLHDDSGKPKIKDGELEAVTNHTLSNALKQLASVVQIAKEIFDGLNSQLVSVTERTKGLRARIDNVEEKVSQFDPKSITVPESDLSCFSELKNHYKRPHSFDTGLFTVSSRPPAVQQLYDKAVFTPVPIIRDLDRFRRDGTRSSKYFSVTPTVGQTAKRKKRAQLEIETRKPAFLGNLRRWTSTEALGSVTVDPDCTLRISSDERDYTDHTLPSPEEQLQAIALKFPVEVVPVDVSGKSFRRMTKFRRSLTHVEYEENGVKKRGRARRPRGKRRNTIAGTDSKELEAIVGESSDNFGKSTPESGVLSSSGAEKKSHLENLKEWGRSRFRQIRNIDPSVKLRSATTRKKWDKDEIHPHSSSGNWSASSESGQSTTTSHQPRSSISSGSTCMKHKRPAMFSASSSVTSESTLTPDDGETCSMYSCDTEGYYTSFHLDSGLKTLREEEPCPPMHCTSALSVGSNANESSLTAESEYELFGKGSTSTTASSNGTVCTTLLAPPTPERTNSQLSGNKTLPERNRSSIKDLVKRETQSLRLDKKSDIKMLTLSEIKQINDSHLNINTNAATIANNLNVRPQNSMITVEIHNERGPPEKCGDSPDSGHNTCSSPVDSVASPIDLEMSECSDLEGVDRVERIRVKTTINSSRIPSMCVITPPQSDDEISLSQYNKSLDSGDYVTISEVKAIETDYISLNDLPPENSLERRRRGARVTLDAEGKVIYSSDSLRRKKTTGTFEPGPCAISLNSPVPPRHITVRPVQITSPINIAKKENNTVKIEPLKITNIEKENNTTKNLYIPKSAYDRLSPSRSARPLSPLAANGGSRVLSPSRSSPKMVVKASTPASPQHSVKGAYVKIQEDQKYIVKRSDSYRQANDEHVFNPNSLGRKQYGPAVRAGPSLLTAIQTASNSKASRKGDMSDFDQSTWPRSTSTPTKSGNSPSLDFTSPPSPIHTSSSPSKSTRSAMDLYAVIHESKKRIQSLQKPASPTPVWPKSIPGKPNDVPKPMPSFNSRNYIAQADDRFTNCGFSSLPRLKVQTLEESPRNLQRKFYTTRSLASDRLGTPTTSRNDFKRLLLQKGLGSVTTCRGSAVERLKNKPSSTSKPLSYNVLSTTIPEDCGTDDEQMNVNSLMKSSALVNAQNRVFQTRGSPTLETAL